MKKIYLLLVTAGLFMAYSCEKDVLFEHQDFLTTQEMDKAQFGRDGGFVSVPFKLTGYTELLGRSGPNLGGCGGDFCFLNLQGGKAVASHLGEDVVLNFTFCVKVPEVAGGCAGVEPYLPLEYNNATGTMVADNGDELYLELRGTGYLIPTQKPGYNVEFQDTFDFTGGTGRFDGASGYFVTDSYNRGLVTDHEFSGILKYRKK